MDAIMQKKSEIHLAQCVSIENSLKYVLKGPIDNTISLR